MTSFSFVFIQQEQMAHLFWWHSLLDIWTKKSDPLLKTIIYTENSKYKFHRITQGLYVLNGNLTTLF